MPGDKYVKITIDGQQLDYREAEDLPLAISYRREDPQDFQRKRSAEALSISVPATLNNDKISNTFRNPGIDDATPGQVYRKPRPAVIEANGYELLVGKAFLKAASHTDQPGDYEYDFYGNNGDWIIALKEATLFDFLKHIEFPFTKQTIIDSWAYDGTSESLPYVFAPVRYGEPFSDAFANLIQVDPPILRDYNLRPDQMRPSISKYWIIYWAFKSLGYRVQSDFLNTEYFRRQVMPWTWGNFLFSEGTRTDNLDFLAKSTEPLVYSGIGINGHIADLKVSNDNNNGGFDNNGVYEYNAVTRECRWTYLPAFNYGPLNANFAVKVQLEATVRANAVVELRIQWFKNGVRQTTGKPGENINGDLILDLNAPVVGRRDFFGMKEIFQAFNVVPGDVISARFYAYTKDTDFGDPYLRAEVIGFELDFFRIPLGGTISFENFTAFKKHKFLEFLAGVVDEFNLSMETDPVNKVVLIEPEHPYSLGSNNATSGGFQNGNYLDWTHKQDVRRKGQVRLYSEAERELVMRYKDDPSDGILKVVQDRYQTVVGQCKYVLPERFKTGKREIQNRFFSPVMHYTVDQWKGIGTDPDAAPQIIAIVPENRSNTSRSEAQNTFNPKSAYYKGMVTNVGWVFDGLLQSSYPFMFAVNYQNGANDPVLSYSDELIQGVVVKGLLKRFYLQRLAIMRNGQFYSPWVRINNLDASSPFKREHIVLQDQRWELVEIQDYSPVREQSTQIQLRKWVPVSQQDAAAVFPTSNSVQGNVSNNPFDTKYSPLTCLRSDIPTENP